MNNTLKARTISSDNVLLGYLDLCGTKAVYETLELNEQVNRIIHAVSTAWTELSNAFGKDQQSLYVHMFADSLVIAQRKQSEPDNCINKLVDYLISVQFQMLRHSQSFKIPLLSRSVVKRGRYFGILFDHAGSNLDETFLNLSLVGGPSVVEMDKLLKGLPVGVYIEQSLASQYADRSRLISVEGEQLSFVKPPDAFISFERFFGNHDFDTWIDNMIDRSNGDQEFKNKIKPWADVIQNRATSIQRAQVLDRC
jgi:hypothetical protein